LSRARGTLAVDQPFPSSKAQWQAMFGSQQIIFKIFRIIEIV